MSSKAKTSKAAKQPSLTKAQLISELAKATDLTNTNVNSVFDALTEILERELKAHHPLTLHGLLKVRVHLKKEQKPRQVRNPKTEEFFMSKYKPAHYVIKVSALSKLKEMAPKK
jgi:nucleoid DNA-binding protein